jgi:hypothetical protein
LGYPSPAGSHWSGSECGGAAIAGPPAGEPPECDLEGLLAACRLSGTGW